MKIEVKSLARVEGHGGILVEIVNGKIKNVNFKIFEGPRLIETLTIGKTPEENISLVSRICAICTLSHRYASIRALERALNIKVPLKTKLTRTLMHLGEIIESHSLHVFFLSLPDLIKSSSAITMLNKYKEEIEIGLKIKKFGNSIMKCISGRIIHGENPVLGGFGKYPSEKELLSIKEQAENLLPHAIKIVEFLGSFSFPSFYEQETIFMALNPANNEFGFVGDTVLISTGEERSIEDYKNLTNEKTIPYSFARHSSYNGKSFSVGALARMNLLGERLENEAGKCFRKYYNSRWKKNPLFNVISQAIEIVYCLEKIPVLIDKIIGLKDPKIKKPAQLNGEATGAVEAPRGILYHHYRIENGLIAECDIITPTAQNLRDIEKYFRLAVENLTPEYNSDPAYLLETIARAYDPCISCSTHLVEVKNAKNKEWKKGLSNLFETNDFPVFIGLGNLNRGDDGAGIIIAKKLKNLGCKKIFLGEEFDKIASLIPKEKTIIFIDACDFASSPGEIGFFTLDLSEPNLISTHTRILDLLSPQIKKFHLLAIQPASLYFSSEISPPVSRAIAEIVKFLSLYI